MMRMTKQVDYAIGLLTSLARKGEQRRSSAADLARATKIPVPMAIKLLKILARGGILDSQRGFKGGYQLARPAGEVSLADVLGAVEGPIALTQCSENAEGCQRSATCLSSANLRLIDRALRDSLGRISLSEMCQPLELSHRFGWSLEGNKQADR